MAVAKPTRYTVGLVAGVNPDGSNRWEELDFLSKRLALGFAKNASKEYGTAIVARTRRGKAVPVARFNHGVEWTPKSR